MDSNLQQVVDVWPDLTEAQREEVLRAIKARAERSRLLRGSTSGAGGSSEQAA